MKTKAKCLTDVQVNERMTKEEEEEEEQLPFLFFVSRPTRRYSSTRSIDRREEEKYRPNERSVVVERRTEFADLAF